MSAIRFSGRRGIYAAEISSGDTPMLGEFVSKLATVGAATIPAASMLSGILYRSGSTAAYTDTFDTAANILTALAGSDNAGAIVVGSSFRLRMLNSVAFAQTVTLGSGMIAGVGTPGAVVASGAKDYLFTFQSVQPPIQVNAVTTNGSPTVNWVLPPYNQSIPEGPSPLAVNLQPGASVTGTGIPAGTTVLGIIQGQGGTIGATLSANATATTTTGVLLNFGPSIVVDDIGGQAGL